MAGETPPSEKVDEHFQIKIIWANRKSIAILFTDIVALLPWQKRSLSAARILYSDGDHSSLTLVSSLGN
jgi:hypothetical protein